MLTSDEKEGDYKNTVANHEGVPIRPHSDALYPKVHVVNGGRELWLRTSASASPYVMSREYATALHAQLTETLGLTGPCPTSPLTASHVGRRFDVV